MKPKSARTSTGRKPRIRSTGYYAVYLFYVEKGGVVRFYEWWDPDKDIENLADLKNKVETLTLNAFNNGKTPPYVAKQKKYMLMRRKSYVAFVANQTHWDIGSPLTVTGKDHFGSDIDGNHTFIHGGEFVVPSNSAFDKHHVVYYENYLASSLKSSGPLSDDEKEKFDFVLPFTPKIAVIAAPDSGGTNMGPPVPPPFRYRSSGKRKAKS